MAYPMPGQTDFTAAEEQQMRQSQSMINSLSASANAGKQPAAEAAPAAPAAPALPGAPAPAAPDPANNREAGLNPLAAGVGKMLGRAVFGGGSGDGGGGGDVSAGNIGGTAGDLPPIV